MVLKNIWLSCAFHTRPHCSFSVVRPSVCSSVPLYRTGFLRRKQRSIEKPKLA